MSTLRDLTGLRFGELTVIERAENRVSGATRWLCKCDCGKETIVYSSNLTRGKSTSCGCSRVRKASEKNATHREGKTRLHGIWTNMLSRCRNPNVQSYKHYGGRGIVVCEEWLKYENFRDWAHSTGYNDELTIERNNPDGDYCPENCRWATWQEQANNKRTSRFVEFNGETHTVAEWAHKLGMDQRALWDRLYVQKWSVERALTTPPRGW